MTAVDPTDPNAADLTDQTLGNYHLLRRLGRGGMADVYLAEQSMLQRQVAVKTLRRDLACQDDYVRRFHNEARAVAALVHANIVQIYEVGCEHGVHFIAQEYVPGPNLKQLVTRNGPLEIGRAVSILRQMAAALFKAAQRNIIHRDIKPENILLSPTGEVKVADFGLARVIDPQNVDLTQAGLTMGTPLYMSPEQVEGKTLDQRSDLYSCGATAFYMLAGRPPFQGDTPLSVAVQHLQTPPPSLAELRPDAPGELCEIVHRLLEKRPADRYASAAELLRALRALPSSQWDHELQVDEAMVSYTDADGPGGPLAATRRLQTILNTQSLPRVTPRRRWATAALGVLSILGGALLAAGLSRDSLLTVSAKSMNSVQRQATASEQYWHAVALDTPEAFESVARYHPPDDNATNRYYHRRALQQLANHYLQRQDYERALQIYQQLAALPETESEFRAIGLAGQVIVHDRRGETEQAEQSLAKVINDRGLLNRQQADELDRIEQRLRQSGS